MSAMRFMFKKKVLKYTAFFCVLTFSAFQLYGLYLAMFSETEWETCPTTSAHKDNEDAFSCQPLHQIERLRKVVKQRSVGKYMQVTDEEREEARLLLKPSVIENLPSNCQVHTSDIKWNLVFLVKSGIQNQERRKAIRSTWGAVKIMKSARLEVIFLLGTTDDQKLQDKVKEESEIHNDVLQMDIPDSPRTVPEKVLAGMQWSSEALPKSWLYASMDDDILVHTVNLVNYFETLLQPNATKDEEQSTTPLCYEDLPIVCVYGYRLADIPDRKSTSKWYLSFEQYPSNTFPAYCRGGLYIMPNKLAKDIYEVSKRTPYLHLDDVWITGFMRQKLGAGNCNILPAPFSEDYDAWFWSYFFTKRGDEAFVRHLWGDTSYRLGDVPSLMQSAWKGWHETIAKHATCTKTWSRDYHR